TVPGGAVAGAGGRRVPPGGRRPPGSSGVPAATVRDSERADGGCVDPVAGTSAARDVGPADPSRGPCGGAIALQRADARGAEGADPRPRGGVLRLLRERRRETAGVHRDAPLLRAAPAAGGNPGTSGHREGVSPAGAMMLNRRRR